MQNNKKTWGGSRPGAGRPTKDKNGNRTSFTVMVAPATRKRITELRDRGVKMGEMVDGWVEALAKDYGIE